MRNSQTPSEKREALMRHIEGAIRVDGILRPRHVEVMAGLNRVTLYRKVRDGLFPPPLLLGEAAVPGAPIGWRASTVAAWLASRPQAKGGKAA